MNRERAWIATKKGLFELRLHGDSWGIERVSILGEPVTMLLTRGRRRAHAGLAEHRPLRHQGPCQ